MFPNTWAYKSAGFSWSHLSLHSLIIVQWSGCVIVEVLTSQPHPWKGLSYQNIQSSVSALLIKDNSLTIHKKNLKLLATEIFKIKLNISLKIMNRIFYFSKNSACELRCGNCLSRSNIHSTHFGIESIANIAPKIWNKIPNEIKEASSLSVFKSNIKLWVPQGCPCRLCKTYVGKEGFIYVTS